MRKALFFVLTAFLMMGCVSTRYVPVETVRTEYKTRTDTFIQKDTIEREKTVTIMEADSDLLAKYGILLRQNRNKQNTILVLQKEIECEKSSKQEVHTDTMIQCDTIRVPYPVEKQLTFFQQLAVDWFTYSLIACALLIIILLIKVKMK